MKRVRIAQKVLRVTADFIDTMEYFSDGTFESAVYYFRDSAERLLPNYNRS